MASGWTPTPFGFGGWVAMTKGTATDVMMGDLVLTQEEVNPVMSALLENGLAVTALHNHFFWDSRACSTCTSTAREAGRSRAHGEAGDRSDRQERPSAPSPLAAPAPAQRRSMAKIAQIVGTQGEQSGAVYKITIGRDESRMTEMARRSTPAWGSTPGRRSSEPETAAIAGDVAMVETRSRRC